jgi:hypothetical protein
MLAVSIKTPESMLLKPGFGLWPPLRTANLLFSEVTIFNATATSRDDSTRMKQAAGNQQVVDLDEGMSGVIQSLG